MLFLLDYHKQSGRLAEVREFPSEDRVRAQEACFEIEREIYRAGTSEDREVVLLEAESLDALRRTHLRYFGEEAIMQAIAERVR